jgi:starch-binding outer membrane protein, SusD/RagB family
MRTFAKYILAALMIIIASCSEDFVDLKNPNQITSAYFWKTQNDAVWGTNAIYQALIFDGTYMRKYPWTMDARADDTYNVTPYGYVMSNLTTFTIGGEEVEQQWECNYVGIWRANQLLDNIDNIAMDVNIKERCKGEAKFLRGLFYFNLLNLFQNVVLYMHTPASVDDYYNSQSAPAEVWEVVYQDLKDAIGDDTKGCWRKDNSKNELGRATKGAAAAFLAKAYMMNHRYNDAAPILKDIIDGKYGTYALVDNYRDNFIDGQKVENNAESIFEIQYDLAFGSTQGWIGDPAPDWQKQDGYNKSLAAQPFGWGDLAPSVWIYNEFQKEKTIDDKNDPRMEASLFFAHPGDTTYKVYGYNQSKLNDMSFATTGRSDLGLSDTFKVFIRKYLTENETLDKSWKSGINRRLVRYADILLLYAECLNEAGQTAAAYPYIQQVRTRSHLADLATIKPTMTQAEMRMQLDHERALELCFEAWRYLDLIRWGYFSSQDIVNSILVVRDPEFKNWIPGREYLAIPPTEIERTNGIVKQNDAWN